MFSSLKCNPFSITQSVQDNLGNGKPRLMLRKAARKAQIRAEV